MDVAALVVVLVVHSMLSLDEDDDDDDDDDDECLWCLFLWWWLSLLWLLWLSLLWLWCFLRFSLRSSSSGKVAPSASSFLTMATASIFGSKVTAPNDVFLISYCWNLLSLFAILSYVSNTKTVLPIDFWIGDKIVIWFQLIAFDSAQKLYISSKGFYIFVPYFCIMCIGRKLEYYVRILT